MQVVEFAARPAQDKHLELVLCAKWVMKGIPTRENAPCDAHSVRRFRLNRDGRHTRVDKRPLETTRREHRHTATRMMGRRALQGWLRNSLYTARYLPFPDHRNPFSLAYELPRLLRLIPLHPLRDLTHIRGDFFTVPLLTRSFVCRKITHQHATRLTRRWEVDGSESRGRCERRRWSKVRWNVRLRLGRGWCRRDFACNRKARG